MSGKSLLTPLLLLLAATATDAHAAPGLVTACSGTVLLDGLAAPVVPFVVAEDARLELGADGEIVVLVGGVALRRATAGVVDLTSPTGDAAAGALPGLLQRQVDTRHAGATKAPLDRQSRTSRSGATRAGAVELLRPVPGADLLGLSEVRWRCDAPCPDSSVHLRAALDGTDAWAGSGAGAVQLPGLDLSPGLWELTVGGDSFALRVPDDVRATELRAALEEADAAAATLPETDVVGRVGVRAAVRWQLGLPSDALAIVDAALRDATDADRAALQALLQGYEALAAP